MDITLTLSAVEVSALRDRALGYTKDGKTPPLEEFVPDHFRQLVLTPLVDSFQAKQKQQLNELFEQVDQETKDTVTALLETAVVAVKLDPVPTPRPKEA